MNGNMSTEWLALNPKVYSYKYLGFSDDKFIKKPIEGNENELIELDKKTLKGVSKVVVNNEIKRKEKSVFVNNKSIPWNVVSIRSFNHQLFTTIQTKQL